MQSQTAKSQITPDRIAQLGFGFWGSKTLLSAIELGLFTELAKGAMDAPAIQSRFGRMCRKPIWHGEADARAPASTVPWKTFPGRYHRPVRALVSSVPAELPRP